MKPGVDAARTGVLPQAAANAYTACATAGSVARPEITSTSGISGTGLKKCMPTTRPGCLRPVPSAVIDNDDVFEARMHPGAATFSMLAKSSRLAARSSAMASITSPATQVSASVTTVVMRASAASASAAARRPLAVSRCSASAMARLAASAAPKRMSCSCTRWPCSAAIWAIPAPMVPAPTTATRVFDGRELGVTV